MESVEAEQTLELADGAIVTTKFDIEADADHAGLREYRLRAKPMERETQRQDNERGRQG